MPDQQTSPDHSLDLLTNSIRHDRTVYRWFLFFELQTLSRETSDPGTNTLLSQLKKVILCQSLGLLLTGLFLILVSLSGQMRLAWLLLAVAIPSYLLHSRKKEMVVGLARRIYLKENTDGHLTGKTLFHLCESLARQQGQPSLVALVSRANTLAVFLAGGYLILALVVYPISLNIPQALAGFLIVMVLGRLLCDSRWFYGLSRSGSPVQEKF